jgi:pilus retraction protein PilT
VSLPEPPSSVSGIEESARAADLGTMGFDFSEVLRRMVEARASDVHLTAGFPPAIRDKGKIVAMEGFPVLNGQETREVVFGILNDDQRKRFENNKQLDFAYAIPGVARFRVNCFMQRGAVSAAFRLVPQEIPALDSLGVPAVLRELTSKPRGFVLVTGPTGSGKSTTLFGALKSLYQPGLKILTAENPIEYVCDGFRQHEVDDRLGNTFAKYLRSFLRHDPDVIMIGEIRDSETAELAFRAAQTGHLVLSTLHTNDAISVLPRLQDLGVDSNLIASSLLGVLSQRLVRAVCVECREPYAPPAELLAELTTGLPPAGFRWYRGQGCRSCSYTGYRGRVVLAELWTPNDADVMLINRRATLDEIRKSAQRTTLPMADDVAEKLRLARTNLEEVIRTLPHSALRQLRLSEI